MTHHLFRLINECLLDDFQSHHDLRCFNFALLYFSSRQKLTMTSTEKISEKNIDYSTTHFINNNTIDLKMTAIPENWEEFFPNTNDIHRECISLFRDGQFRSCEILARLTLSKNKGEDPLALHLLGECALVSGQFAHARSFFQRLYLVDENLYRFKEGLCLQKMGSLVEATTIVSGIPAADRDFRTWMLLGNLSFSTNRKEIAQKCFIEAIRKNPYAMEAVEKLAELGIDSGLILTAMGSQGNQREELQPCKEMTKALSANGKHFLGLALQSWKGLNEQFPNNVYFLTKLASVCVQTNDVESALQLFENIRILENTQIEMMDHYAHILGTQYNMDELLILCDELLSLDSRRPEGWTAYAIYHENMGNHAKALEFIEKALSLDDRNSFAYRRRGAILMDSKRPNHASVAFFRACEIKPEVASYEGLVDSYISAGKYREAIASAKEAISIAPRDARAMTLVGRALAAAASVDQSTSQRQLGLEKATRTLRKAISIDPSSLRPLVALVNLYTKLGQQENSVKLLKEALEGNTAVQSDLKGQVHILSMLGDAYFAAENHQTAMDYYHRALGIDPCHRGAQAGLERLECLLRGIDPSDSRDMTDEDHSLDDTVAGSYFERSSSRY